MGHSLLVSVKQSVCICWCTEVGRDGEAISFADGKTPVPIWEPHLCVLHFNTKRLLHFRTEMVNIIHKLLRVLTSEGRHKGSNAPSSRSPVVDEERMRPGHWL